MKHGFFNHEKRKWLGAVVQWRGDHVYELAGGDRWYSVWAVIKTEGTFLFAGTGNRGDPLQSARWEARNGAFVVSRENIFIITVDGDLLVRGRNGVALEEVRRYEVANRPVWTHPTVFEDGVIIKDEVSLRRFDY